jgi:hypothetical protein
MAKIYALPSKTMRFTDLPEPSSTEIIRISTPIAQGFMESIAAAATTRPRVGKSTIIDMSPV